MKKDSGPNEASSGLNDHRGRPISIAMLLILVVLLSASSGIYAGASYFAQQGPGVTVTTTIFTTTTSWATSTFWSTVTSVVEGVWTTVQYTTSTSTVTVTGSTSYRTAKIVTANGNAQISTTQSKFGGASGLFDGTGDYLSTPDSADWAFGTGDFTIDYWVRFNALPTSGNIAAIWDQAIGGGNPRVLHDLYNNAGTYYWRILEINLRINMAVTATVATNTWYHMAVVRSGNSWYIFQNGVQVGSTYTNSNSLPDVAGVARIGSDYAGTAGCFVNGWLDEFRISKGVARWTSNFTPPTGAYTSDSNTVLLLHMDGAEGSTTFIDGY